MSHPVTDLEHECHCDDPRREGKKLWLCGTELCKRLTSKAYRNGYPTLEPLILSEEDDT